MPLLNLFELFICSLKLPATFPMIFWISYGNFNAVLFPCCHQLLSSCLKESSTFWWQFQAVKFCMFHYASVLILNAPETNNFAAISMQINFNHNVNNKLASSSASCLRSGDWIGWVFEKLMCEYNVIISVKKIFVFKFNCSSGECSVILQDLPTDAYWIFLRLIFKKITMHAGLQHIKSSTSLY